MPSSQPESAELPLNADDATSVANNAAANELSPQVRLSDAEVMSVISLKQLGVDVESLLNQSWRSLVFDCEQLRVTPRLWVTPTLVVSMLVMFGLVCTQSGGWIPFTDILIKWGANIGLRTVAGESWRLLTCVFLHAGVSHLLLNAVMLWSIGRVVERLLGNGSFLIVFLFAGICGSLASVAWNPQVLGVGASGAAFGIIGAHLGVLIRQRQRFPKEMFQHYRNVSLIILVLNLAIGFTIPNIDLAAHFGGLAGGFVFGLIFTPPFLLPPAISRQWQLARQAALALIVCAGGAMLLPVPKPNALNWANVFPKNSAAQVDEDRKTMAWFIQHGDSSMQRVGSSPDNPLLRDLDKISAVRSYIGAYDIALRLSVANRDDQQAQRDLSQLSDKLRDVFQKLGRTYEAQKRHDLAVSFNKLGDVFWAIGRSDDALAQFQEVLRIRRDLADEDSNDAGRQSAVIDSLEKVGRVYVQAGKFDQAQEQYGQGIILLNGMTAKTPADVTLPKKKAWLESQLQVTANGPLVMGDWDRLLKADHRVLPQLLMLRAVEMLRKNELTLATQAAEKLRDLDATNNNSLYDAARVYARCAELVIREVSPEVTEAGQSERQKFLELALGCLKLSLAAGYENIEHMRQDREFKGLHGRPEFEGLFPIKKE